MVVAGVAVAAAAGVCWWAARPGAPVSGVRGAGPPNASATPAPPESRVATAALVAPPAPPASLHIALVALRRGPDGRPIALLAVNGGPARAFVIGDVVSLGVRLQRTERSAVVLQRGRFEERLPLPAGAAGLADAASAAPARTPAPDVIAVPAGRAPAPPGAVERAVARARAGLS
jgi:general secretion pathway protein C